MREVRTISTSWRRPPDLTARTPFHAVRDCAVAFILYEAIVLATAGIPYGLSRAVLGFGSDPLSNVWFLAWWPWAVAHGQDPFWSRLVFAPGGYALGWAASIPTAALLAWPATLLAGPVVAFNLLTLAAPAAAGTAAFLLVRTLTNDRLAALFGGFVVAFSGYENAQVLSHLNLDLIAPLPIVVVLFVRRVANAISRRVFVPTTTLVLLAQFGISIETFATLVTMGTASLVIFAAFSDRATRGRLITTGVETAICVGATFVLATPLLVGMVRFAPDVPDFVNPPAAYSNDIANLVVPTGVELLAPRAARMIAARFTGNPSEQDLYLGLPLIAMVVAFAIERRRHRAAQALVTTIVALIAASLGPWLHVAGARLPVPLPWAIAGHLPLLRGALPCRIGVYVALAASLAAAFWLANRPRHRPHLRVGLAVLACAALLPGRAGTAWTRIAPVCAFAPVRIAALFGVHPDLLVLPYGSGSSMFWQAQSGMRFSQPGGLLSFVQRDFAARPDILPLLQNRVPPGGADAVVAFARHAGATAIVAGPGTGASLRAALAASGRPIRTVCGVDIIPVGDR